MTEEMNEEQEPVEQVETRIVERDEKGRFLRGHSGNPLGNTKNRGIEDMLEAIRRAEKSKGENFWDHVIDRAYKDDRVMIEVLRKLVPDRKAVESSETKEGLQLNFTTTHVSVGEEEGLLRKRLARIERMKSLPCPIVRPEPEKKDEKQ